MKSEFPKRINGHEVFINELGDFECEKCDGIGEMPAYFEEYCCTLMRLEARRLKLTPVVRPREDAEDKELYENL
jgi:hypothetical protein